MNTPEADVKNALIWKKCVLVSSASSWELEQRTGIGVLHGEMMNQ